MGVDIAFYIQKQKWENHQIKWEPIYLFTSNSKVAEIWRCGWDVLDLIKEHFKLNVELADVRTVAKDTGWYVEDSEDNDFPQYHAISLSKLNFLANDDYIHVYETKDEHKENQRFFQNLKKDIDAYLSIADEDYIDMDNIRIICFVG